MNKKLFILPLLIVLAITAYCQKDEEKLIRKSFDNYKSAILNDKGEEAVKYVDSRTVNYYSGILDMAKNADSAKIASSSLMDRLMVFSIRHRTSREDILSFDGEKLLVYAIKSGMVGKNSVANNGIGEVSVVNDFAKVQLVVNGQATPVYFHFYKEQEVWKLDLTSIFSLGMNSFKAMIEESGKSENDFLFDILERLTGKRPGHEIWNKIQ